MLLTPTGSGLNDCVEGQCVMDFELVETDCSETGQVCQSDESNIGSCVDPAEIDDTHELSEAIKSAKYPSQK